MLPSVLLFKNEIDMRTIKIWFLFLALSCVWSCQKLDIPPVNIVQDKDVFTSQGGITAYMARLYSELPIEDFRFSFARGFNHFWVIAPPSANTGEALSRDVGGAGSEPFSSWSSNYWPTCYRLIRECNYFLQTLPKYASNFTPVQVSQWLGETRMIRAVTYFSLVKRFGGVPIVDKVLNYPAIPADQLNIPRSSEEKVYDFIASDLDSAFTLMPEIDAQKPETNIQGRANKYAAAAFKSRAMLYAGTIAKYNQVSLVDGANNRLCGIPVSRANDYYKASFAAAKLLEGKFSLYLRNWAAGDKQAQFQNYVNLFSDNSSPENIFVKQYHFPESVHGYDAYNVPRQLIGGNGYSSEISPTLNFVEMFDGIPKNPDGTFQNLDATGHYVLYNQTMDPFANAEPRLRATVILPGDMFKGQSIEIRRALDTGFVMTARTPLLPPGWTAGYNNPDIYSASGAGQGKPFQLPDGSFMLPAGKSGYFTGDATCSLSGFSIRKYLNEAMPQAQVLENNSAQTWIELRYAEVLLNRAEAAYELYSNGVSDVDYLTDAYNCINKIRTRAGANLLSGVSDLNSIDIVRRERRKELAFENHAWWDLRRWRIALNEQNSTTYRILNPIYQARIMKYYFDVRTDELNRRYTFDPRWYYEEIPAAERQKSPALLQNPGF